MNQTIENKHTVHDQPKMIEMPDWSQLPSAEASRDQEPDERVISATALLAGAESLDAHERLEAMRGFVDDLYADVETGSVVGSGGDVYTAELLTSALGKMIEEFNKPVEGKDPITRLPRASGIRASFDTLISSELTTSALTYAIAERLPRPEIVPKSRIVSAGGNLLQHAGIVAPAAAERVEIPVELPASVQAEMNDYRALQEEKKFREGVQDYDEAGALSQKIYFAKQALSPRARKALGLEGF
jgi:hypothetical protein